MYSSITHPILINHSHFTCFMSVPSDWFGHESCMIWLWVYLTVELAQTPNTCSGMSWSYQFLPGLEYVRTDSGYDIGSEYSILGGIVSDLKRLFQVEYLSYLNDKYRVWLLLHCVSAVTYEGLNISPTEFSQVFSAELLRIMWLSKTSIANLTASLRTLSR